MQLEKKQTKGLNVVELRTNTASSKNDRHQMMQLGKETWKLAHPLISKDAAQNEKNKHESDLKPFFPSLRVETTRSKIAEPVVMLHNIVVELFRTPHVELENTSRSCVIFNWMPKHSKT